MKARYDSICPDCGKPINKGDEIKVAFPGGGRHAACMNRAPVDTTATDAESEYERRADAAIEAWDEANIRW